MPVCDGWILIVLAELELDVRLRRKVRMLLMMVVSIYVMGNIQTDPEFGSSARLLSVLQAEIARVRCMDEAEVVSTRRYSVLCLRTTGMIRISA
jgi:hypothetical protein